MTSFGIFHVMAFWLNVYLSYLCPIILYMSIYIDLNLSSRLEVWYRQMGWLEPIFGISHLTATT